jgi:hypothetical protein
MSWVRALIDRLLLVAGVVTGGLVPGFIAQYRQRLGGRLDQARLDLEPWQAIANQHHQGDLGQLVQYHLASHDPTFFAEGQAIQALIDTVHRLQEAVAAMHASLLRQAWYLAFHADPGLLRATYVDWVPTFSLSAEGLAFAACTALLVWLVFQAACWLFLRQRRGTPRQRGVRRGRAADRTA